MSRERLHSAILATCVIGMLFCARAHAADITIAGNAAPVQVMKAKAVPPRAQLARPADKRGMAKAKTGRERARLRPRRIRTYNLFNDPAFKLAGAVRDMRQLQAAPGPDMPAPAVAPLPHPARPRSGELALRMDEAAIDTAGIAFDCREKTSASSPFRRGMTACYKARLAKSWKTQTYISKGFAEGDPEWGGGLSFTYAH